MVLDKYLKSQATSGSSTPTHQNQLITTTLTRTTLNGSLYFLMSSTLTAAPSIRYVFRKRAPVHSIQSTSFQGDDPYWEAVDLHYW